MTRLAPTAWGDKLAAEHAMVPTGIENVGLAYHKLAPARTRDRHTAGEQARFVRRLAEAGRVPPAYEAGFRRWCTRTPPTPGRKLLVAQEVGRVACGLGIASPTENGLSLHPLYGTPVLPGSSLKGITRAWAERRFQHADPETQHHLRELFGDLPDGDESPGLVGLVSFLDAWWIPEPRSPWVAEVLTPHAADYYRGKGPPDGMEGPNPVTWLAARGSFRIVLEGPDDWLARAAELLGDALREKGVGARTRAGFGRFGLHHGLCRVDEEIEQRRIEEIEKERARQLERQRAEAFHAAPTPAQKLDAWRQGRSDDELVATLRRWLKDGSADDDLLAALDPDGEGALAAAVDLLQPTGGMKGLTKTLPEHRQLALADLVDGVTPDPPNPPVAKGFGPNHLDPARFWPASRLGRSNGLHQFATWIAKGDFDEPTVRAALEWLRQHGARPGHLNSLLARYPVA